MAGLGTMIRLILRRDRVKLPLWIVGFVGTLVAMVPLLRDVYGDEASLQTMHATFGLNPSALFMTGPMDEPTFGALFSLETLIWWGIAIAFLNTLLIVRHTRHNEEIGAQELLLSGQMKRSTSLVAALVVALGVNALIVLGIGAGLEATDPGWATSQSWLFALAMGAFGLAWAAIASVVVQLTESGRSANGMLAGLIGVGFIVRGIGDFLGESNDAGVHIAHWASSLSPFGWMQATRPLTSVDWSALLVPVLFAAVATTLGFILLSRRDVGEGLLPSRRGKQRASRLLASPLGLTLYLQKNTFIGWLVAVVVMVAMIGVLVPQMSDMFDSSEGMRHVVESIGGAGELVSTFLTAMIAITCLMVFAYTIQSLGKLRSEEASGHIESLLATKLSRFKWAALHVGTVFIGGTVMLATIGLTLALLVNGISDFTVDVREYTLAGLSYVPLMLAFMALYLMLFGLLPRVAGGLTWLYFGFVAFALWLGPIVQLSQSIMNLSIMEHITAPPAEEIAWEPLLVITAIALAFILVAFAAWRRRDMKTS